MRVVPALTQTTASAITPGGVFVAQSPAGASATYLRIAGDSVDGQIPVVALAPTSTALNWLTVIAADAVVSDVSAVMMLAYDLAPSNLRFPSLDQIAALACGDVLIDGKTTLMVVVGPNPASGIGFVDLATGEIGASIGENPMQVLSWALLPGAAPT